MSDNESLALFLLLVTSCLATVLYLYWRTPKRISKKLGAAFWDRLFSEQEREWRKYFIPEYLIEQEGKTAYQGLVFIFLVLFLSRDHQSISFYCTYIFGAFIVAGFASKYESFLIFSSVSAYSKAYEDFLYIWLDEREEYTGQGWQTSYEGKLKLESLESEIKNRIRKLFIGRTKEWPVYLLYITYIFSFQMLVDTGKTGLIYLILNALICCYAIWTAHSLGRMFWWRRMIIEKVLGLHNLKYNVYNEAYRSVMQIWGWEESGRRLKLM
ncbi:MAG: hypothetical protein OEV92_12585, partial [Nitrospinota bacterium]|nr:hypothetical protein [Nitrospinota bacterium]